MKLNFVAKPTSALWMALALFVLAQPATAGSGDLDCPPDKRVGSLGISDLECSKCSYQRSNDGRTWRFSVEPIILGVRQDGPAANRLRRGDMIVSIDDLLITTRQGGERYAKLEPGESVRLVVRRDGRLTPIDIVAEARCEPDGPRAPRPPRPPRPSRPTPDSISPRSGHSVAPRPDLPPAPSAAPSPSALPSVPSATASPRPESPSAPASVPAAPRSDALPRSSAVPAPPAPPAPPKDAYLGLSFTCKDCEMEVDEAGETHWRFRTAPKVQVVPSGSPASRAGIQPGDHLTHVDGHAITSPAGARRFQQLRAGTEVDLRVDRGGRERLVRLVPDTVPLPELPSRLRFTGSVAGAEVEVRGGPVNVSEDDQNGEIVIRTSDAVIIVRRSR